MVHLLLSSTKGNQGLRHFPHSGYLGLTPVKVDGIASIQPDAHAKILRAKSLSVSVRCYESRQSFLNSSRSCLLADYTQLLWSKPDHLEYDTISTLECPFSITIPVDAPGFSTSIFVDYRCVWRVEAVLEHAPVHGIGSLQTKHFDLFLIRYDVPSYEPLSPKPLLNLQTTRPKAPRLLYCVHSPTSPIGPKDLVTIPIYLQPLDPAVFLRSATLTVERRIQFKECITPQSARGILTPSNFQHTSPSAPTTPYHDNDIDPSNLSSTAELIPKLAPMNTKRKRPVTAPVRSRFSAHNTFTSPKAISDLIAGAESSGNFSRDRHGVWNNVLTLQWPAPKSQNSWSIGETIDSTLVSVKFLLHVKVIVSSPGGVDSIELAEKELLIVSTGDADRQLTISKFAGLADSSKSPTKPSRKGRSESQSAAATAVKSRRPHTSTGITTTAPHRSGFGVRDQKPADIVRDPSLTKLSKALSRSSIESASHAMREWEEELARIERQSRQSSELLGFSWKRRRPSATQDQQIC